MANRHLSRSVVLQSLFEWDARGRTDAEACCFNFELNTEENIKRAEEAIEASDSMQVPVRILSWKRLQ